MIYSPWAEKITVPALDYCTYIKSIQKKFSPLEENIWLNWSNLQRK